MASQNRLRNSTITKRRKAISTIMRIDFFTVLFHDVQIDKAVIYFQDTCTIFSLELVSNTNRNMYSSLVFWLAFDVDLMFDICFKGKIINIS